MASTCVNHISGSQGLNGGSLTETVASVATDAGVVAAGVSTGGGSESVIFQGNQCRLDS